MILVSIDVGSTKTNRFGWCLGEVAVTGKEMVKKATIQSEGNTLNDLFDKLSDLIGENKILIGLEAPLFFELNENNPNQKRIVDPPTKSFSAGAGVAVAMTCLTHMVTLLKKIKSVNKDVKCALLRDWSDLDSDFDLLFFETMVTGSSKAVGKENHTGDAKVAYDMFIKRFNEKRKVELSPKDIYSLIGNAIRYTDLPCSNNILKHDCLVVDCTIHAKN